MTPSVLAERSHARGEGGRARRPLVPLESPADPRNSAHSRLSCGGPRAGPASQCLFLALCCNVYSLLHACPPARLGTATFCCPRGCCLAWADLGRRLALCRVGVSGRGRPLSAALQSPVKWSLQSPRRPLPLWSPVPSMLGALCSGSQDPEPGSPSPDSSCPPALCCRSGGVCSHHDSSPFSPYLLLPGHREPDSLAACRGLLTAW